MPIPDPIPEKTEAPGAPPPHSMDARRLRDWVRAAKPGARIVYARGACLDLSAAPGVAELARDLAAAELVRLHLKRPARGAPIDYLMIRCRRPMPKGMAL